MTESFKIINSNYYMIYKSVSTTSWILSILLFLLVGPGCLLVFDIFGKEIFTILVILFFILFGFNLLFKSKMLKLRRGKITFTNSNISINWDSGKRQIFDNSQISNLKIKHGSTFKRLTTEADIGDGLDNFIEFEYKGDKYQIQLEINSLSEDKNLLNVINEFKNIFTKVNYIKLQV